MSWEHVYNITLTNTFDIAYGMDPEGPSQAKFVGPNVIGLKSIPIT